MHEMSKPLGEKKKKEKYFKMWSAEKVTQLANTVKEHTYGKCPKLGIPKLPTK